jgi:8-oxo-dGTP pyrophosphatase MutT (NUDIX family)
MILKNLSQSLDSLSSIVTKDNPAHTRLDQWSGAVVLLIVEDHIVFIKRSNSMPTHKGEIAFMGGHKSSSEISPIETGIREFSEESGFALNTIEVKGLMVPVLTSHQRVILPVVAKFCGTKAEFLGGVQSNGEWSDLVLVPIEYLLQTNIWTRASVFADTFYHVHYAPLMRDECSFLNSTAKNSYILWGATAKMVVNFFQNHLVSAKDWH